MSIALKKQDPLIYEFETAQQAESYRDWLEEEVRQSRLSSTLSNEEAMNRLDAIRARLMEQVRNAD